MIEYVYKKSMALGGDDGILLFNVKISKPCLEHPKADITFTCLGEAGQNKAVFDSTDFLDALEMFTKVVKNELQSNLAAIRVEEQAMKIQAEMLDPEKLKQKFLAEYMLKKVSNNNKEEVKSDVGSVTDSTS